MVEVTFDNWPDERVVEAFVVAGRGAKSDFLPPNDEKNTLIIEFCS